MKKWKKITINNSNYILKGKNRKNSNDFAKILRSFNFNDYYQDKKNFFKFYLKGIYITWDKYLRKNLQPNAKTLSIASGRGINELSLIADNYNITCSDIEIPKFYQESKKLFGNFNYLNFNILSDNLNDEFDNVIVMSAFYIFSYSELEKIFYKINKILKKDGTLIFDIGGPEDNSISHFFHEIYLVFEAYTVYYLSKIFNKKIGLESDGNFGFRWKNKEIIDLASRFGFKNIHIDEYDYLTELQRSVLVNKIIKLFPSSRKKFELIGKKIPYIRMFKFKKI